MTHPSDGQAIAYSAISICYMLSRAKNVNILYYVDKHSNIHKCTCTYQRLVVSLVLTALQRHQYK